MRLSRLADRVDPAAFKVALRTAIFMPVCFGLVAAGCVLIVAGTLLSHCPTWVAVLAAGLICFAIFFLGIVNPYIAAARNGAVLALALPLMIEAPDSAIDDRLAGWLLAAAICIPATYLLWRLPWVGELRRRSSEVCEALAELVTRPNSDQLRVEALERVATLRHRFLATPHRPTGATGVSAAIASLVEELGWLYGLVTIPGAGIDADGERAGRLRQAIADLLGASSDALAGGQDELPVDAVASGLEELVGESIAGLTSIRDGDDAERAARQLEHEFRLRKVAYAAMDVARMVEVVTERERAPGMLGKIWAWFSVRSRRQVRATGRLISEHADVNSSWFQNSVRGAIGIALAVLAADLLSVQNAFWVVLGTLSVLRNNALGTRGSIGRALVGTLIGIIVGSAIINLVGSSTVALWIALPLSVLFAAYAPRAISFAAGQAGFAVLVVVLYNLIEPIGWQVAIIRIQDVAVGCAVSLVVGLLIWPRGAASLIRRSLADSMRTGGQLVRRRSYDVLEGKAGVADPAWEDSVAASDRLDAVLRQYLDETATEQIDRESLLTLASSGLRLRRVSRGMGTIPQQSWFVTPGPGSSPDLERMIDDVSDWFGTVGESIEAEAPPPAPLAVDHGLPRDLIAGIDVGDSPSDSLGAGVARLWLFENLAYLAELSVRYNRHARDFFGGGDPGSGAQSG